ncbi:hypothetical protein L3Q67_01095 [Saccharothrix sp. AJ9571]|nr:hypothetical protein L3Q67_01095 [Saccharothrix sp. AJ9571]
MSVSMSGKLPKDERNGAGALSAAMVDSPEAVHVIVALVDCAKITTDIDTGDIVPTMRIRAIEGFPASTEDAREVRRLWRRAFDRRLGKDMLPLEIERVLDDLTPAEDDDTVTVSAGPAPATAVDVGLLCQAAELVISSQFGSGSMLQRKLRIGFALAQRLVDQLEHHGVLATAEGGRTPDVLVPADQLDITVAAIRAAYSTDPERTDS